MVGNISLVYFLLLVGVHKFFSVPPPSARSTLQTKSEDTCRLLLMWPYKNVEIEADNRRWLTHPLMAICT